MLSCTEIHSNVAYKLYMQHCCGNDNGIGVCTSFCNKSRNQNDQSIMEAKEKLLLFMTVLS